MIVPSEWHHTPSAQRQSSAYSSVQRQSSAYPVGEVCNVLYGEFQGLGCQVGALMATHPMEVVTVSMYVIPMASFCTMQLVHIVATVSWIVASSCRGSGGTSKTVAGNGSLCRQAITSWKPGGGATSCTISRGQLVMWILVCLLNLLTPFCPLALSPPAHITLLWGLCFDSWGIGGACPVAVTG